MSYDPRVPREPRWLGRPLLGFTALAVLAVLATGCGYSLAGKATNIPEDIQEIYVEPLENQTARSQVEQFLTEAIIDEMVTRSFEVVGSLEGADAVLRGKVLEFSVTPVSFDPADGLADNFQIQITADMVFQRPRTPTGEEGEVVWKNSRYVFRQDYPLEDEGANYFDRETLAIEETSIRFAETMVTDLLEGF